LGLDLTPEIHIEATTNREAGTVTLVGTRAALGQPDLDSAFRLQLVAVLSQREVSGRAFDSGSSGDGGGEAGSSGGKGGPFSRLRLRRPRQLPGRPVYRLRKLVARARGRDFPPPTSGAWDAYAATHLPSFSSVDDRDAPVGLAMEGADATASLGASAAGQPAGCAALAAGGSIQQDWEGSATAAELRGSGGSGGSGSWAEHGEWGAGWAASSRADAVPVSNGASSISAASCSQGQQQLQLQEPLLLGDEAVLAGASTWSAPDWDKPPQQAGQAYLTSDESDDDYYGGRGFMPQQAQQDSPTRGPSYAMATLGLAAGLEQEAGGTPAAAAQAAGSPAPAQLGCRVSVRVALKVPAPARVVPNALLGYAGESIHTPECRACVAAMCACVIAAGYLCSSCGSFGPSSVQCGRAYCGCVALSWGCEPCNSHAEWMHRGDGMRGPHLASRERVGRGQPSHL
jgi:hypothetical protein